jgi:hypothetical protein
MRSNLRKCRDEQNLKSSRFNQAEYPEQVNIRINVLFTSNEANCKQQPPPHPLQRNIKKKLRFSQAIIILGLAPPIVNQAKWEPPCWHLAVSSSRPLGAPPFHSPLRLLLPLALSTLESLPLDPTTTNGPPLHVPPRVPGPVPEITPLLRALFSLFVFALCPPPITDLQFTTH